MKCTLPTPCCIGDPTQPIFHWLALGFCVGGNANFMFLVGGKANFSVILDTNMLVSPTQILALGQLPNAKIRVGPYASSFALQWNIGFKPIFH